MFIHSGTIYCVPISAGHNTDFPQTSLPPTLQCRESNQSNSNGQSSSLAMRNVLTRLCTGSEAGSLWCSCGLKECKTFWTVYLWSSSNHSLFLFNPLVLFQVSAVARSGRITLYDVCSCTAICHIGLPVSYLLSSQLPCICANGKALILIGAQSNEDNQDALDIEVSVWSKTLLVA